MSPAGSYSDSCLPLNILGGNLILGRVYRFHWLSNSVPTANVPYSKITVVKYNSQFKSADRFCGINIIDNNLIQRVMELYFCTLSRFPEPIWAMSAEHLCPFVPDFDSWPLLLFVISDFGLRLVRLFQIVLICSLNDPFKFSRGSVSGDGWTGWSLQSKRVQRWLVSVLGGCKVC